MTRRLHLVFGGTLADPRRVDGAKSVSVEKLG